jgi:thiol-disulfide isomerase/thioredoxin
VIPPLQSNVSFRFCALFFVIVLCAWSRAQQNALDLAGKQVDPFKKTPEKLVVLTFIRTDCPISNRYAPLIQQLGERYAAKVSFWLIFPDKTVSALAIRKYLREYGYNLSALRDPDHVWVKRTHVQVTPEAAVFNASRELIYHGRIDNFFATIGRVRPAATTHELEDSIQAALAGRLPAVKEAPGVGCYISDLQ